jgi:hypothetical protein
MANGLLVLALEHVLMWKGGKLERLHIIDETVEL